MRDRFEYSYPRCLRLSVRLKLLAALLLKVSKETLERNCAGGGGLLRRRESPAGFSAAPSFTLCGFGCALEEREGARFGLAASVFTVGTNCTEACRVVRPSIVRVGRRQEGMKEEVEFVVDGAGFSFVRSGREVVGGSVAVLICGENGEAGLRSFDDGAGVDRGDGGLDMVEVGYGLLACAVTATWPETAVEGRRSLRHEV